MKSFKAKQIAIIDGDECNVLLIEYGPTVYFVNENDYQNCRDNDGHPNEWFLTFPKKELKKIFNAYNLKPSCKKKLKLTKKKV